MEARITTADSESGRGTAGRVRLEKHLLAVAENLARGDLVPFLGAGVNLSVRRPGEVWAPRRGLPSGRELSRYLADGCDYPKPETAERENLLRVSQYFEFEKESGPLYRQLRDVFASEFPVSPLHEFLARLARLTPSPTPDQKSGHLLIVTTNYDDVMEAAWRRAGQAYDVVGYMATGEHQGRFLHFPPNGPPIPIRRANTYRKGLLQERPTILKLHGLVDRQNRTYDSFVIAEDHYIDYLARLSVAELIPVELLAKLKDSCMLFLGYSLSDWNLRVILDHIWGESKLDWPFWAVQFQPDPVDTKFWKHRGIEVIDLGEFELGLGTYMSRIYRRLLRWRADHGGTLAPIRKAAGREDSVHGG